MKQYAVTVLLAMGLFSQADAQSFLQDVRSVRQGEGRVTVTQSKEIDELVDNAKLERQTPPPSPSRPDATPAHPTHRQPVGERSHVEANHKQENHSQHARKEGDGDSLRSHDKEERATEGIVETPTVNTAKKVMRNSRKVTGYRVQAFSGGNSRADRRKAENIGNAIKMKFPDLPVYVHFYSPRWICRVGNFRTYQEAANVLREVKRMGYRQACIVKGKITVGY